MAGILENDALRQNPYLRRFPKNDREWVRFVQTLNAQRIIAGLVAFKTTATSRDNTTTLAADPDLQLTLDKTAVYKIELQVMFRAEAGTSGNQGFNFAVGYSGSLAIEGRGMGYEIVNLTPAVHAGALGGLTMSAGPIPGGVAPIAAGAQDQDGFHITWLIETSTAGTLSVNWAQAVSSADDTLVLSGSYMVATRLSE